jgi:hypothetical protein
MKKILLMLFIIASTAFALQAQTNFSYTSTNPTGAVLNATIDTLNLTVSPNYYEVMTIQALVTKTSGTMAGTVRLYGSNFNNVAGSWQAVSDTLTLSNATTNVKTWTLAKPGYKYYQILQSGGTTVAGTIVAKAYAIKPY